MSVWKEGNSIPCIVGLLQSGIFVSGESSPSGWDLVAYPKARRSTAFSSESDAGNGGEERHHETLPTFTGNCNDCDVDGCFEGSDYHRHGFRDSHRPERSSAPGRQDRDHK